MNKELILATHNVGKVKEYRALLSSFFTNIKTLGDLDRVPEVVEDGQSFKDNALKKARAILNATGRAALADDSGLEVSTLGGRPGIRSARFAGERATDSENIDKLLIELEGEVERQARFVCSIALIFPDGTEILAEGSCSGTITTIPKGTGGFGYDPVFMPDGYRKTMAEIPAEEKNRISHRAKATLALLMYLDGLKKEAAAL